MTVIAPEPFAGTGGAVVPGVDVSGQLDAETVAAIREALVQHKVLVFPDQDLTPAQQVAFSRRFGEYGPVPFIDPIPDHPEVIQVVREPGEAPDVNFGGVWHSDFSFQDRPPAITLLYAVDVPPYGGDTVWSNMELAYDALSEKRRASFDEMVAVHTARDSYSPRLKDVLGQMASMKIRPSDEAEAVREHPLVTVHPESDRPALIYNQGYVKGIRGLDAEAESSALRYLHQHTTHVRFTTRHRWSNGDLVMWDNRSTQHYAMNDYPGYRRELLRTTVAGTTPRGLNPTPASAQPGGSARR